MYFCISTPPIRTRSTTAMHYYHRTSTETPKRSPFPMFQHCAARRQTPSYCSTRFYNSSSHQTYHGPDSGLATAVPVVVLLTLALRDPESFENPSPAPSCALLSKKFAHNSARDSLSLADVGSEKTSALSEGELGVLWKGDVGSRKLPTEPPGRARPACSRCSSVQFK